MRFVKSGFKKERRAKNENESVFYDEFALKEWLREMRIEKIEKSNQE